MELQALVHDSVKRVSQGSQLGGNQLPQHAETFLGEQLTQILGPHDKATAWHAKNDRAMYARQDAGETYFIGRDLEYIVADPFPVEYDELLWRQDVPVEVLPPGAFPYSFRMRDRAGRAKFKSTLAGDIDRVSLSTAETQTNPFFLTDSYGWDVEALRKAARAQMPLDREMKQAAMDVIEEGLQRCAYEGDTTDGTGAAGFFARSFAGAPAVGTLPNAGSLAGLTFDEALANFAHVIFSIATQTHKRWGAGSGRGGLKVGVSVEHYKTLAGKQKAGVPMSALTAIQMLYAGYGATIGSYPQLHDAAANGTDERIVGWHFDARAIRMPVQEYAEMAPQWDAYSMVVHCWAATTGVISPYPLSTSFFDQPE